MATPQGPRLGPVFGFPVNSPVPDQGMIGGPQAPPPAALGPPPAAAPIVLPPDPILGPVPPGSNNPVLPTTPGGIPEPGILGFDPAVVPVAGPVDEGNLSGTPLGPTDAVTRTVQDNELVSNQLNDLLAGDSTFITNARQRAAELSNRRGQFTSSLFAGSAERAAIEAGLPIAQNDAQAFRDAAGQNLAAQNQNAIANIQRAAQLDTALLSSRTNISLANLDASTRVGISNMETLARIDISQLDSETRRNIASMNNSTQLLLQDLQSELQLTMQSRNIQNDRALAEFNQQGRMQLALLDGQLRERLQAAGFQNDFSLAELNGQQQLELNTILQEYDLERQARDQGFNLRQSHINMAMQAQVNYVNYLSSFAGTEMDANAVSRLQQQADAQLVATFQMINGLYPNQPPINVEFGTVGQPAGGPGG